MHRAAGLLAVVALVMAAVPISPALAPTSGPAVAPAALVSTVWKPIPSYRVAAHDEPAPYRDGCHAARAVTVPRACVIVHPRAAATVLLFGDSHAAHWYGAVRAAAVARGWRLLYLTKSSCPAADVAVRGYKMTVPYPQCSTWRGRALTGIAENRWGRVDVAVLSNWHFHTVLSSPRGTVVRGADKVRRWEAGMRRTLAGVLLGAVWSPCVGPTLGGAISLASQGQSLLWAGAVMAAFAAGVASVILALGYGARAMLMQRRAALRGLAERAKPIMGMIFVAVGVAILLRWHHMAEGWLIDTLPAWLTDLSVRY